MGESPKVEARLGQLYRTALALYMGDKHLDNESEVLRSALGQMLDREGYMARARKELGLTIGEPPENYKTKRSQASAIVTTDAEGRITEINRAFTEMCGYTLRELRGKKPGDILQGPQTEQAIVRGFHKAVAGRKPFECTLTNYHKDGSTYRVHIKMAPIKNEQTGSVSGFRAVERKVS